jgi:hypothetical protein
LLSSLIEFIINIALEEITRGILKQNFINDQWEEALVHKRVIASHLSSNLFLSNIYIYMVEIKDKIGRKGFTKRENLMETN